MPQQLQLALVAGAALMCALVCAFLLYRNRGASRSANWKFHLAEIIILCVGMLLLSGWMNQGLIINEFFTGISQKESHRLESIIAGALFYGVFALPVLILTRFVRARFTVALLTALWMIGLTYGVYLWKFAPVVQEVRTDDTLGLVKNSFMLDMWTAFPRIWIWALLSVLGGFYAVRKSFSYVGLIIGTVIAGYISLYAMSPFAIWNDAW